MLSEYAVLGFEYGYSLAEPNALTLWEAQFGDFANGAQIMFDQFISFGRKQMAAHVRPRLPAAAWLRRARAGTLLRASGTVPDNVRRRQLDRGQLHNACELLPPAAPSVAPDLPQTADPDDTEVASAAQDGRVSKTEEFTTGSSFHRVLWDDAQQGNSDTKLVADDKIKRVVMCSGKVYYDLLEERDARGINDVYIMRFEQFYPFPAQSAVKELERFKNAEMVWCQEEPKNQGAWSFMEPNIEWVLTRIKAKHTRPVYAGRAAAASPATGLASKHKAEQAALVNDALTVEGTKVMSTEVRVPTLGESVTEATVATWFKKPGDAVAVDEMLCELETDKVTVEVPSPVAGTLSEIVAAEGETVGVDALLAQISRRRSSGSPQGRSTQSARNACNPRSTWHRCCGPHRRRRRALRQETDGRKQPV